MGLTTSSYEGQLSMMSEHVASMNDKLATQTDQVRFSFEWIYIRKLGSIKYKFRLASSTFTWIGIEHIELQIKTERNTIDYI